MYSYWKKKMAYIQSCTDKCSTTSSQREQAFMCSVCWFLGCKYPHHGQFQATSILSLNAVLARGVHCGLYLPQHGTACIYTPPNSCMQEVWESLVSEQYSRSRACLSPPQTYCVDTWAGPVVRTALPVRKAFPEAERGLSWAIKQEPWQSQGLASDGLRKSVMASFPL